MNKLLFSFKGAAKCLFVKMNSFSNIFNLNRKMLPGFKRNKKNSLIRKFGDLEFEKTCHEHVIALNKIKTWFIFCLK